MGGIFEGQKDLTLFKRLLSVFAEYTDKFPATGIDGLFQNMLENGINIMPKNQLALEILSSILLSGKSVASIIQDLLNMRFADLGLKIRPVYKVDTNKKIAFWGRNGKVYDKVLSLIDFEGEHNIDEFVDEKGDKVTVIEIEAS